MKEHLTPYITQLIANIATVNPALSADSLYYSVAFLERTCKRLRMLTDIISVEERLESTIKFNESKTILLLDISHIYNNIAHELKYGVEGKWLEKLVPLYYQWALSVGVSETSLAYYE